MRGLSIEVKTTTCYMCACRCGIRVHLKDGEVRFLQYMMNIEAHTIVYLKELLSTKVVEDAEVTAVAD